MSIYIHSKNQELLWSTMMKVPQFKLQHAHHPNQIVFWFRNVIGMFYDKYWNVPLQVQDLQTINRETVSYMVQSLQKNMGLPNSFEPAPLSVQSGATFHEVGTLLENKTVTRNYMMEQKQAEFTQQFSERQREYDQMLKGPAVQEVDFRMVEADQPIENMDELIQQHMKSREEIVKFATPPLSMSDDAKKVHWSEPVSQPVLVNVSENDRVGNVEKEPVVETSTTTLDTTAVLSFMAETRQFMEQTRAFMVQAQSFQGRPRLMDPDNVYLAKRSSSF